MSTSNRVETRAQLSKLRVDAFAHRVNGGNDVTGRSHLFVPLNSLHLSA